MADVAGSMCGIALLKPSQDEPSTAAGGWFKAQEKSSG